MQYWIPKAVLLGAAVSLSGCGLFTSDAHHERNYRASEQVRVPANLEQPAADPEFKMDVAQYDNNEEVPNLRPPSQVLTVAEGSWVDEDDKSARVYFDKNDGIQDLDEFVWQAIDGALENNQAKVRTANKLEGTLETDWLELIKPETDWFWESSEAASRQRFKFTLEEKSHHRTTALRAELIEFDGKKETLTPLLRQQLETRMLNQVVAEFDYNYRRMLAELQKQQGDIALELGFDSKGNAALIAKENYQVVFDRFTSLLERLSFTMVEADAATGRVIADYSKPEASVWDAIWGDEVTPLPLAEGQYQLMLSTTANGGTSITWMDPTGNAIDPQAMSELQKALLTVLEQRNLKL